MSVGNTGDISTFLISRQCAQMNNNTQTAVIVLLLQRGLKEASSAPWRDECETRNLRLLFFPRSHTTSRFL